jgi:hypothetical protein
LKHFASPKFWAAYGNLPESIQRLADKNFALLKEDPQHPSLRFKKIGNLWSARVGIHYRSLGIDVDDGVYWFRIGTHADYDKIIE